MNVRTLQRHAATTVVALGIVAALVVATSARAAGNLDQSQPSFGPSFFGAGNCGGISLAQTFTAGITGALDEVAVGVWRDGSNTSAPLELEIYAAPDGSPSGEALARATVPASRFVTDPTSATFTAVPITPVAVATGARLAIVLKPTNQACFAGYWWIYVEGNAYPRGEAQVKIDSGAWQTLSAGGPDFAFSTYVTPAPTTIGQCMGDGWRSFPGFKNQGDGVAFVATGGKNGPG